MSTKNKIKDLLSNRSARPNDLAAELGISAQALHRHLKAMLTAGEIERIGTPPQVFYRLKPNDPVFVKPELSIEMQDFFTEQYAYVDGAGHYWEGLIGFEKWVQAIGQNKAFRSLAEAYLKTRKDNLKFFTDKPYISSQDKINTSFKKVCLKDIFYQDFYSIPQFGKTKLGHLLTLGKSGQHLKSITQIAKISRPILAGIIQEYKIEAIAFIPHSIPRKISFLHEFKKDLHLDLPQIEIVKAFANGIPIAQKSLSKLQERIDNARNTIFIKTRNILYQSVLLIDDAVGSGATMNETACKLRQEYQVPLVYGFCIAGSLKGFDVIAEI